MPSNEIELFKTQLVYIQRSFIFDFCFYSVLAINLSTKPTKRSCFLYLSDWLTSLAYHNFCGLNSSKKRDLCYRYGDHKVKADLSLVFFQIPERGKKIIEHRWHVIFSKRENPIWIRRCVCFFLIKNHKWTSDKLIQSLIALRGVVKRAADSPFPSLVVLLLSYFCIY